jgi:hypothetical protein
MLSNLCKVVHIVSVCLVIASKIAVFIDATICGILTDGPLPS